jgi:hypothetical protein
MSHFCANNSWARVSVRALALLTLCCMGCSGSTSLSEGAATGGSSDDGAGASAPSGPGGITLIPIDTPAAASNTTTLPLSLAPVVDITTVSGSTSVVSKGNTKASVSTGIPLSGLSDATFSGESARAACAAAQNLHDTIRTAATTDIGLCLIQELYRDREDFFSGTTAAKYVSIDYDSSITGNTELLPSRQFYVTATRDGENRLTNFTMRGCQNGTQKMYLTQTLDPSVSDTAIDNYVMAAIVDWSDTDTYHVTTTGNVAFKKDTAGKYIPIFTKKEIETDLISDPRATGSSTAPVVISEGTFTQTSSTTFSLNAYTRFGYSASSAFPTKDYLTVLSEGTLIDENDPAQSLLQGISYEPQYDLAKIALGSAMSEFGESVYNVPFYSTEFSDSSKVYLVGGQEQWSATTPFSVLHTFDTSTALPFARTPASLTFIARGQYTLDQSWDCSAASFDTETITATMFDRCSRLSLEPATLDCDPFGENAIHTHLADVTFNGGTGSVMLRSDTTPTFSMATSALPGFTLTFDGFENDIANLVSRGLISLTTGSTTIALSEGSAPSNAVDANGEPHKVSLGPTEPIEAGTYTLTIGPNIGNSTQQWVFTFTMTP